MKINANHIKVGHVILHCNKLFIILKTIHTKPGKNKAYIQIQMKEVTTGNKINYRFKSAESIVKATLNQENYELLYEEYNSLVIIHKKTFEQKNIPKSLLRNQAAFIKEGIDITLVTYNDEIISASLPTSCKVTIKDCESIIKGQSASSSYKPAILENGVRIMVPPFINQGDNVVIDTKELKYIERLQ